MERLSLGKIARAATLVTLPLTAGLACGNETIPLAPTSIPGPTETLHPYGASQDTVDKVVNKFGGAVVFTAEGLAAGETMIVDFQRVDIPKSQRLLIDDDSVQLTRVNNRTIFAATSCKGRYSVSVSLDNGESHTILPIPNIKTRVPQDTFELRPDCTRPVTFTLQK